MLFVDYWNVEIGLNQAEQDREGGQGTNFSVDWEKLPKWLYERAKRELGSQQYEYAGMQVYASYDSETRAGKNKKEWLNNWLRKQRGVQVRAKKRRARRPPVCPNCHDAIIHCPHCEEKIKAKEEKGVDTAIATDMIKLAWEGAYDVGVLATSDSDLVPAAEFLGNKGFTVIQANLRSRGHELAQVCWSNFDLYKGREVFRRTE